MTVLGILRGPHFAPARGQTGPRRARRDWLGLLAGWPAYRLYDELNGLDDAELARRGMTRQQLPRMAALLTGLIRD